MRPGRIRGGGPQPFAEGCPLDDGSCMVAKSGADVIGPEADLLRTPVGVRRRDPVQYRGRQAPGTKGSPRSLRESEPPGRLRRVSGRAAEPEFDGALLAVAREPKAHRVAGLASGDRVGDIRRAADRDVVDGDDRVAAEEGRLSGTAIYTIDEKRLQVSDEGRRSHEVGLARRVPSASTRYQHPVSPRPR